MRSLNLRERLIIWLFGWIKYRKITLVYRDGSAQDFWVAMPGEFSFDDSMFMVLREKWWRKRYMVVERARNAQHGGFTDRDAAVMFARFLPVPKQKTTVL